MIKLYKGAVQAKPEDICLFMLDSSGPSKIFTQLVYEHEPAFTHIDFSLLEKKYHFHINCAPSLDYPILKFLEELEKVFPQIIWTKITKNERGHYKVEFIPVPFQAKREDENGSLADCLEEMGYHAKNLIPTFRNKFEEVFKSCDENLSYTIDLPWSVRQSNDKIAKLYDSQESNEDDLLLRLNNLQSQLQKKKQEQEDKKLKKNKTAKDRTKNKKRGPSKKLTIMGGSFTLMLIIILGLNYFYSIGRVEGDSMKPTLSNSQLIVTEKHPDRLKRSDIIVFKVPQMSNKEFVKRIIGLPGDTVYASQGNIYVNGEKVTNQYDSQSTADFTLKEISGRATVPEDKLFVLGDNRSHSTDSRNFGFVDKTEIKGKVVMK